MGSGIAQVCAQAGIQVNLNDANPEALDKGLKNIAWSVGKFIEKGKLSEDKDTILKRIRPVTDFSKAADADMAIEVVFERKDLKLEVFKVLDGECRPDALIASNTSAIPITELAAATPTGGGGMIAFASTRNGEPQIFLFDLPSGEETQLTDIRGGACQPEWANDGMRLVFIAPCKQNQQSYPGSSLFIINADGTQMNPLPSSPIGDYDPSWSPVDNRIVFTTIRDFDRPQIWVLDVDTGQSVNLSQNSQADYQPSWSADGSKILFSSNRVIGRAKLWVMDADGQNVVEFSRSDNRTNIEAVWSPDGDQVVFTQFDSQGRGIPILVGTNWRDGGPQAGMVEFRISDDPAGMREPDFSSDGLWIVFASNSDPNNLDIYIMRVNGAELTPLVVDPANDFDPAWKP